MTPSVLLVDDDAMIRRSLSSFLGRAGYEVHTAEDGAPAIASPLSPDLVVVDFNMPTCGLEVVRHFKTRLGAAVYVIAMTGGDEETRDESIAAGADAVLSKPFLPSELKRRLAEGTASLLSVAVAS
ncbi:MAG: DNA-binding response regulator [Myxococcales bacterium]|nr:DNA-binding response regulator [Myxococcales bacterium]